jgi:hypothetical protein
MNRVLLDTNVLIHREARTVVRDDIGTLFLWLDKLGLTKLVHPLSLNEIKKHADDDVVRTLSVKLGSYSVLKTLSADSPAITAIRAGDSTENDSVDTSLLAEVAGGRVDALISEDRGIHRKAAQLGLSSIVFTIDAFLEKVTAENPGLADYRVLSARQELFGNIDVTDPFFDSFRADYPGFNGWFNRKADEVAYVCTADKGRVVAFLYLKREGPEEGYGDISPSFAKGHRLKIGTFKVVSNGFKLGERFLKIVFDNALRYHVSEIYVTIFRHRPELEGLAQLLMDWGFALHGQKSSSAGKEDVLVRNFRPGVDPTDPRRTYPYASASARKFVVPIYPDYHTELLPDSILRTESPDSFLDSKPNRNALSKVYVSRSLERGLRMGDIIVFYRTASGGSAYYTSVATTLGVVQDVILNIKSLDDFVRLCRKRSVFTDAELAAHWNYSSNRPFIVNFLYLHSFPKKPNRKALMDAGIMGDAPRGFSQMTDTAFNDLMELAGADKNLIVR